MGYIISFKLENEKHFVSKNRGTAPLKFEILAGETSR
jgi:hypothetical protein